MTGWRALASVVLMLLIFATGLFFGRKWEAGNQAADAIKRAADELESVKQAAEQNNERVAKLQRTLDRLPKTEKRVNDAVRDNPSNCHRPEPVADSLQAGVREANAARKVSGDP